MFGLLYLLLMLYLGVMEILEVKVNILKPLLFLHVLANARVAHWCLDFNRGRQNLPRAFRDHHVMLIVRRWRSALSLTGDVIEIIQWSEF